ncbi:MAG: hypothetical protein WBE46_00805, partial [Dehalococcoidia bacterium]
FYGSVGMLCFSRCKAGFQIVKKKPQPSRLFSPKRAQVRKYMSWAIESWRIFLTPAEKADWEDAAANFAQTRHGVAYSITGHNLWVAYNVLGYLSGAALQPAPTVFAGRMAIRDLQPSWNAVTHKLQIDPLLALNNREWLLVWWSNADHPTATYRKILLRNFAAYDWNQAFPVDLDAQYRAADGTIHLKWATLNELGTISTTVTGSESYPYV